MKHFRKQIEIQAVEIVAQLIPHLKRPKSKKNEKQDSHFLKVDLKDTSQDYFKVKLGFYTVTALNK